MNFSIDPTFDHVTKFAEKNKVRISTLKNARQAAVEVKGLLSSKLSEFLNEELAFVAFGSLARMEWTSGSDVDWTLLVDGQATTENHATANTVKDRLSSVIYKGNALPAPGSQGIFGNLSISHNLIHYIGGQTDSNKNTTQRILMLLESTAIGQQDGAYRRVLSHILNRYLIDDSNFATPDPGNSFVPRFLVNDFVRFWRTMCVDFAFKHWEQSGNKWAIRNVKLRMSRKLLFVSAMMMAFSCFENKQLAADAKNGSKLVVIQKHLEQFVLSTPLDIVIAGFESLGLVDEAKEFLNSYESFLLAMNCPDKREHLSGLATEDVYNDDTFLELRALSHQFQESLDSAFFERDTELKTFTRKYGVF